MEPSALSRTLSNLASRIETAKNPSMSKIEEAVKGILAAVEGTGRIASDGQIISHLMAWQNAKYVIDIAYRNFADRIKGPWRDSIYEHWYKHAEEEREQAYNLSMKIIALGADPIHTSIQIPMCPPDLSSFCAILMQLEYNAIDRGQKAVEMAGSDLALKVFAEDIVLIDAQHLDDLKRMCVDYGI